MHVIEIKENTHLLGFYWTLRLLDAVPLAGSGTTEAQLELFFVLVAGRLSIFLPHLHCGLWLRKKENFCLFIIICIVIIGCAMSFFCNRELSYLF